ncbi:MAG: Ig-like domain-containing protein [Gemmatimonadetes bacterium]|nr:Ig-like domain-containing protein [Gemmatimonadota bacterium]
MLSTVRHKRNVVFLALGLAACGEPAGPEPVASVSVFPLDVTLIVGNKQQLSATALDDGGNVLAGRDAAWSSGDTTIAKVSATGEVTAVAPGGPVAITATVGGKSAVGQVTVIPVPIATLELSPNPAQVAVSLTTQLALVARDSAGNVLTGRTATVFSSNPAVATVNSSLVVTGVTAGTTTISATAGGKTVTATVNVVPGPVATVAISPAAPEVREGATLQLTATTRDASGAVVTGRTVTWATSDASKATVSSAGVVTGVAEGSATITATSEGKSASTTVTVLRAKVFAVDFDPTSVSGLVVGDTARVRAVARDSLGRALPDRVVTFSGSTDSITVSSSGFLSAIGSGTITITATSEGKSATLVASAVDVYPSFGRSSFACGGVQVGATCTATAGLRYFTPDNAVPGSTSGVYRIDITGSNPAIATVTQVTRNSANITGVSPGTITITARYVGANGVTTRTRHFQTTVSP